MVQRDMPEPAQPPGVAQRWENTDAVILTYYFEGWMTLRHLEHYPLTDEQILSFRQRRIVFRREDARGGDGRKLHSRAIVQATLRCWVAYSSDEELAAFTGEQAHIYSRRSEN